MATGRVQHASAKPGKKNKTRQRKNKLPRTLSQKDGNIKFGSAKYLRRLFLQENKSKTTHDKDKAKKTTGRASDEEFWQR